MRIGWIGFHQEGLLALEAVLQQDIPVVAVLTLAPDLRDGKSGHVDYAPVCRRYGLRLEYVRNINDDQSLRLLRELSLDLAFVIGWTQIVKPEALGLVRVGMIGAHASLLPADRGRAPINWALIRGKSQTGNSLIWLSEGVDSGDIIDQRVILITPYDTCATLYERVAETNRDMILRVLPELLVGRRPGHSQPAVAGPALPGRHPMDGAIDWSNDSEVIYDLVRALTRPYPGAFTHLHGWRYIVWKCALLPQGWWTRTPPGSIVGPVISPEDDACGLLVSCGSGGLILLELEDEHGVVIFQRRLSYYPWTGQILETAAETRAGGGGASRR